MDRELQDASGLGLSEVLVILQILLSSGRLRMADLADTLVVTRGGVTKIVDRLVEAGYLDRVPSQRDRRVVYAEVTDDAVAFLRRHQALFDTVAERRLAALLDATELDNLHLMLDRLSCENPGWEPPGFTAEPANP